MPIYPFEGKWPKIHPSTYLHPQAVVIGEVEIAGDCFIGAGAVLRGDFGKIHIGPGTSIQDNCVLHVGMGGTISIAGQGIVAHGAILHDVALGSYVLVGMGSILMTGVVCEEEVMIAAGSLVKENFHIPSGVVVAGSPAKILRPLTEDQRDKIHQGVKTYQDLARRYKRSEQG